MILITGDVVLDHNIYAGKRLTPVSQAACGTRYSNQPGGAMLVYGLLDALSRINGQPAGTGNDIDSREILFGLRDVTASTLECWPSPFHAGAVWEPLVRKSSGQLHWRLVRNLGYGSWQGCVYPASPVDDLQSVKSRIVVIDDGGLGFRLNTASVCWPPFLRTGTVTKRVDWIILKMSRPLARGDLWREVKNHYGSKLIVIVSADNLRSENAQVGAGLSWESAVDDVFREIYSNITLRGLLECRHLVITFRTDAALWLDMPGTGKEMHCQLVFDRERAEGEKEDGGEGSGFGYLSAVTAALASYISATPSKASVNLVPALKAGLSTSRFLAEYGHGPVNAPEPGFPFRQAAEHIQHPTNKYADAEIRRSLGKQQSQKSPIARKEWTILGESVHSEAFPGSHHGPARRLALLGPAALANVPLARFGKLLTMDRREIEGLRSVRQLMLNYRDKGSHKQPLSLAVFGAPGSGKSFGLKQIAEGVFGDKNPVLEFNLSQFKGPEDLIGAYHLVRDHGLAGKTPVVFWDEFDSKNNFWLQYLLAPMQDGTFLEGQQSHAIGKCIFVFAGGTSRDFTHFGPSDTPAEQETEAKRRARQDFILAKGPDFKSRLAGFLDVAGPNPRQTYNEKVREGADPWEDDRADVDFPVRRALLLRSLLGLVKDRENEPLDIDRGLLTALLEIPHYRNGARSLEKLVAYLQDRGGAPLRRAYLPANDFLALYVESVECFQTLVRRPDLFLEQAERLAPILHEDWRANLSESEKGSAYNVLYDELDREGKAANVAAATRIPEILALAGFVLEEGKANNKQEATVIRFLRDQVEFLAEAEHIGWEEQKRMEGWTYGPERDNVARKHPLLVAYAELPEEQKDKDRRTILNYPKYARAAGFKIVSQCGKPE